MPIFESDARPASPNATIEERKTRRKVGSKKNKNSSRNCGRQQVAVPQCQEACEEARAELRGTSAFALWLKVALGENWGVDVSSLVVRSDVRPRSELLLRLCASARWSDRALPSGPNASSPHGRKVKFRKARPCTAQRAKFHCPVGETHTAREVDEHHSSNSGPT